MEFGKDLIASLRERVMPVGEGTVTGRCDWHALSARLQAAHAARVELIRAEIHDLRLLGGSFGSRSSHAPTEGWQASRDVNPSDSADGKAVMGIAVAAVADTGRGGRG
jgi:hypothetical protein